MTVSEAVRELRKRLGETQQSFATRLGLAISTVVRYELSRPPKGVALKQFYDLATASGHADLAEAFLREFDLDIAIDMHKIRQLARSGESLLLAAIGKLKNPDHTKEDFQEGIGLLTEAHGVLREITLKTVTPAIWSEE